jgi:hypothetical protein
MARIEDGSTRNEVERRPRWRTPELLQEKLVDATNIDTIGAGFDGVVAYGTPLVNSS